MIDAPAQLIAILVVAFLLFGPKKLPELARGLGQSVREFRRSMEGITEEKPAEKPQDPVKAHPETAGQEPQKEQPPRSTP